MSGEMGGKRHDQPAHHSDPHVHATNAAEDRKVLSAVPRQCERW
jgi:hypothetical protein